MDITILGIESSCDDTSAAVIRNTTLLSNVIASQAVHMKYGGVIPELASRAHQQNIVPVVDTALKEAGVAPDELDAIAFTRGPGLLGSLLVGVSFTKGLALAHDMARVLRIGKHMFIIRLLLSEPPFYCIKLQVKNAIWIMRSWQLTILSMRCLLRNIYYLLSMESSKVFILLFLLSTLLCWYMIAGRLNIFHICTAIFVPVGPTGMKYVAFVAVSIPKHCQPM